MNLKMKNNTHSHKASIKRKIIVFSIILFAVIFISCSASFIVSMWENIHASAGRELVKEVEIERIKLEAAVNAEIALALKMAASPLIRRYFNNLADNEFKNIVFDEINEYRQAFTGKMVFWVSDVDKEFYLNEDDHYTLNPDDPDTYWYRMTLYETEKFNFNINYNTELERIMLWINAPVFDLNHKPIGLVGTGLYLSDFVDAVFSGFSSNALLYFFNAAGEITGARDMSLITNKITLDRELGNTGTEILAAAKKTKHRGIESFSLKRGEEIALGEIPALDWYIAAVLPITFSDALNNAMSVPFLAMMAVIAAILVVFNVFFAILLKPQFTHIARINELNEKLEALSTTDELTQLNNRRSFLDYMEIIWKQSHRLCLPVTVIMIDIDFFKKYNDALGHLEGDKALIAIAQGMKKQLKRDTDFVARYGGEEFVCLLPYIEQAEALHFANILVQSVERMEIPHPMSDHSQYVTISAGMASIVPNDDITWEQLLHEADKSLYKAKHSGRNRVVTHDQEWMARN